MDLSTLELGQTLTVERLDITEAAIEAYRAAVSGATATLAPSGAAPAMAIAAWALSSAMRSVELPQGAVHISQALDFVRSVGPGADLRCTSVVAQNSVRRGVRFLVIEVSVVSGDDEAMRGSATITLKMDEAPEA